MNYVEQLNTWLNISIFQNSLSSYLQALVTFLGLLLALSVFKRILVRYLGRMAKRTVTDFDDFVVSLDVYKRQR